MRCREISYPMFLLLAVVGTVLGLASFAGAELGIIPHPGLLIAQGNQGNQNTTVAGVVVDAQGVLQRMFVADPGGQLARERAAAAKASLRPELMLFSKLRKISLNRLERAIAAHQGTVSDEMRFLAGLLRVRYVFYYPETKDIVIAGPAEGWMSDPSRRVVGISTRRPVVQLQDLVVTLRAFAPGSSGTPLISCSIDPTPEGLAAMQRFLRSNGSSFAMGQEQAVASYMTNGLRSSLGMQNVSIKGVSPKSNFARVLVEADYRMKLIGIGLETPPVQLVSFVDRVSPSQVARNALFRWFFVPDYQCVRVSEDKLAMELVGDGVKLVGEEELVSASGGRQGAAHPKSNLASQAFVTSFTKRYSELAERSPVYAELRNVIDLAVAAAFIQQQDYYGKAGWGMAIWGDERAFAVETQNAPRQVESTVAAVFKGNRLMTPIGGGVHIEPTLALEERNLLSDEKGKLAKLREETKLELAEGLWWWD